MLIELFTNRPTLVPSHNARAEEDTGGAEHPNLIIDLPVRMRRPCHGPSITAGSFFPHRTVLLCCPPLRLALACTSINSITFAASFFEEVYATRSALEKSSTARCAVVY